MKNDSGEKLINDLNAMHEKALMGGGQKRIDSQHKRGKLTARERIEKLLDKDSFSEIDQFVTHESNDFGLEEQKFLGDSVVTGFGRINNRKVLIYSQNFTVLGGSLSLVASKKICKLMDLAEKNGIPIIGINDSGGARIQEGIDSLAGYAEIFKRNTLLSGVVPQITIIAGPAAGGAVYSPAITDFIFMVQGISQMYITGPDVIKSVTGEDISHEDLGGADIHSAKSGVSHFIAKTEEDCFNDVKRLLSYLPSNNYENPPKINSNFELKKDEILRKIIPEESNKPYNVLEIISRIVDTNSFFEIHQYFAKNIITGFGRINGNVIGIIANQPSEMAGMLDIDASDKAARFVRFCDAFNIPLVTLVDVPGFMPGTHQEYGGIIRHGAKLLYAYTEATVPKISVILRKAYGGAYIVMSSKGLRTDINLAWPTAEIAVMGPEGAINIISRKEISDSENPDKKKTELIDDYKEKFANPYVTASKGYLDDVIDPSETRIKIAKSLDLLSTKIQSNPRKKHGNIPL
ncbi:MAG: methylmalonyl-CoA carboxyltransferase [Chloroflexi bacterium]|mgnify:CR=1 FL=1|nr:methylmalonyl-CoA carboxyltransferase [Chloroflexota bacterium]